MSKEKQYYIDIDKLLKYDSLDKFMFGFTEGLRYGLPSVHITKAIDSYMEHFCLNEDNYPRDHALQNYYRMLESYRKYRKNVQQLDK